MNGICDQTMARLWPVWEQVISAWHQYGAWYITLQPREWADATAWERANHQDTDHVNHTSANSYNCTLTISPKSLHVLAFQMVNSTREEVYQCCSTCEWYIKAIYSMFISEKVPMWMKRMWVSSTKFGHLGSAAISGLVTMWDRHLISSTLTLVGIADVNTHAYVVTGSF